jgi:hypothetical protein
MTRRCGSENLPLPFGVCLKCIDRVVRGESSAKQTEARLADGSTLMVW